MKRALSKFGYFLGKNIWNLLIGIIVFALAAFTAVFTVVGKLGAKASMLLGFLVFGADIILLIFRVFHTLKDWVQLFGAAFLVGLGPALAVGIISAILEKITLTIRDNCFID